MTRARTTLVLLLALAASPAVRAQTAGEANFNIERLKLATDRDGIGDVEWAGIEANPFEYDVALALGYELNPLVLNQRAPDGTLQRVGALVAHKVTGSVLAAITLTNWLEIGAELPVVLLQLPGGEVPGATLPPISAIGLSDGRVLAKFQLLDEDAQLVNLALIPAITVPTAFPQDNYTGEAFPTLIPQIAASRSLLAFRFAGTLGARFRPERNTFNVNVNHELTWQLGAAYRVLEPLEVRASVDGATSLVRPFRHANVDPLETEAGVAWEAWPDRIQVFGGVGVGIIAGFGTPDARVFAGIRWAPRNHDKDGDGILDDVDMCPDDPEDKDGFEDKDGCPDPDNDGDGIVDDSDRCPNVKGFDENKGCLPGDSDGDGIRDEDDKCPTEPEDKDEFEDEDGCPEKDNDGDGIEDADDACPYDPEDKDDYEDIDGCPEPDNDGDGINDDKDQCPDEPEDYDKDRDEDGCPDNAKIIITKKKVFTLDKIYFDFGKDTIKRESLPIIDGVAQTLKDNPELGRIRIEGHTDDKGPEAFNLQLSQRRTESVRKALIARGIKAEQLVAQGFGESKPIATNKTQDGRDKNRRVEFVFIDAPGAAGSAPPP